MRIHDRPELGRRLQARQQRRSRARWNGQHHGIAGLNRDIVVAEFQFADAVSRHAEGAQLMPEPDARALALQQLDGGLDQHRAEALAGDQRAASRSSRQQGFAHDRAGEAGGSLGRIDIECRQQQGLHQPVVQRALAGNGVADQFALPCPESAASMPGNRAGRCRARGALYRIPTAAAGYSRGRVASAGRFSDRRTETGHASARPVRPRCRSIWRKPRHGCYRRAEGDCRCRW